MAVRCSLLIALFRRTQPYSATQSLFKVESDINGILPAADGGPLAIYFVSLLNRLCSALENGNGILRLISLSSFLAADSQAQKLLDLVGKTI